MNRCRTGEEVSDELDFIACESERSDRCKAEHAQKVQSPVIKGTVATNGLIGAEGTSALHGLSEDSVENGVFCVRFKCSKMFGIRNGFIGIDALHGLSVNGVRNGVFGVRFMSSKMVGTGVSLGMRIGSSEGGVRFYGSGQNNNIKSAVVYTKLRYSKT